MKVSTNSEKIKYLSAVFGEPVISSDGENASFSCPVCVRNPKVKKGKKKLSISLDSGMYHCWVCEAKGKNISYFVKKHSRNSEAIDKVISIFGGSSFKPEQEEEYVRLPDDFVLLHNNNTITAKIAKQYLYKRGLSDTDICKLKAGISNKEEFINRIIFPSFDKDLGLNFYLSRTYDKSRNIKYFNCKANKKDIIFNENEIDFSKELILVEGIFDYAKVSRNACCILGSWMDEKYKIFQEIVKNKTPVILALDNDAFDKTQKIAEKLSNFCVDVKIVNCITTDLGDMTKEEAERALLSAKRYDNTDRLRYLINGIKSGSMF